MMVSAVLHRALSLRGWPRWLLACCFGIFLTCGFAPMHWLVPLFMALPVYCWLIQSASRGREAFAAGWWFGFGHGVTSLYWISNSLLVDSERFAWLIPFAVSLIPAGMGGFTGLVALVAHRLRLQGWPHVVMVACLWVLAEYVRGYYVFTGFPWNLLGYVWGGSDMVMQFAAVVGAYGLSLLAFLVFAIPAALIAVERDGDRLSVYPTHSPAPVIVMIAVLAVIAAVGYHRVLTAEVKTTDTTVMVVQGNIPLGATDMNVQLQHLMQYGQLSQQGLLKGKPDIVVWPEAAIPFFPNRDPELAKMASAFLPDDAFLLAGSMRGVENNRKPQFWNTLYAFNSQGDILTTYDKHTLVPFGEYVPLREIIPNLEKVTGGTIDFSTGSGPQTITLGSVPPFSPLICYEAIFPGNVTKKSAPPKWLVNVTNDAWFGYSLGPFQHLDMTRMRAIEEGVPLVRAANTGISAIVDPYGRIEESLPLNTAGVIVRKLSAPAPMTLLYYKQWGNSIFLSFVVFLIITALIVRRVRRGFLI